MLRRKFEVNNQKKSHEYLPYLTQRFCIETGFQMSPICLLDNSRFPRGHCLYNKSMILRDPSVPGVVPAFYHTLSKQPFEVNLASKPLKRNCNCSKLTVHKGPWISILGSRMIWDFGIWSHFSTMPTIQLPFSYSKSTMETLQHCIKFSHKLNSEGTRTTCCVSDIKYLKKWILSSMDCR